MATFSREEIQDGLRRLGELAQSQGLHVRLALVSGTAMVLGYDARQSTRDVDAVILSPAETRLVRNLVKKDRGCGQKQGPIGVLRSIHSPFRLRRWAAVLAC